MTTGCLYWITGLSGSGKTTLGQLLYEKMKPMKPSLVYLDGDILREIYDLPGHYDYSRRKAVAMRHARFCHMLTQQNIDVICSTISLFDEVRQWNRDHILNYKEIYLKVMDNVLKQRDHKQLVSSYESKKIKHMVGKDVVAEFPKDPDITIINNNQFAPEELLNQLESELIKMKK